MACSLLDMLRRKTPYRLNMVCVRYDSFPLLLSLSSVWPTINRTNGKYSWATNLVVFHIDSGCIHLPRHTGQTSYMTRMSTLKKPNQKKGGRPLESILSWAICLLYSVNLSDCDCDWWGFRLVTATGFIPSALCVPSHNTQQFFTMLWPMTVRRSCFFFVFF